VQESDEVNWTTQITPPQLEDFDDFVSGLSPAVELDSTSTELQLFEHFCSKDLLQNIANCTNNYHQHFLRHTDLRVYSRLQQWQDVTFNDIYILIALTMLFTRNKRISIEEHWSTEPLLHSAVFHNTMSRNRYCTILSMLSFHEVSITGSVVVELLKDYFFCNRELYVDNWYTSPRLFKYLKEKGPYACGTVKSNRKLMPKFKKLKRGEVEAYMSPPLLALKWQDKKPVLMLSTKHDDKILPSDSVDYSTGLPKMKPHCVIEYNKNMGTVDTADMMTSTLGCIKKSKKWYKKLGVHVIDIFLLNAFYLFRMLNVNRKFSLADFQLNVIRQIINTYKHSNLALPSTSRGVLDPHRFLHNDALQHFPVRIPTGKSQRCKVCAAKNKRSDTRFMCQKCNVYLCINPCSVEYHSSLKQ
ncbi:hypothetical protein HW555_008167, partial [Spodoptera exigua]